MDDTLKAFIKPRKDVLERLTTCLKENLHISFPADVIHPDTPLFGSGLGLDSIDALEIVMTVENEFGVSLDESNIQHMRTLNFLTDTILQCQRK